MSSPPPPPFIAMREKAGEAGTEYSLRPPGAADEVPVGDGCVEDERRALIGRWFPVNANPRMGYLVTDLHAANMAIGGHADRCMQRRRTTVRRKFGKSDLEM